MQKELTKLKNEKQKRFSDNLSAYNNSNKVIIGNPYNIIQTSLIEEEKNVFIHKKNTINRDTFTPTRIGLIANIWPTKWAEQKQTKEKNLLNYHAYNLSCGVGEIDHQLSMLPANQQTIEKEDLTILRKKEYLTSLREELNFLKINYSQKLNGLKVETFNPETFLNSYFTNVTTILYRKNYFKEKFLHGICL